MMLKPQRPGIPLPVPTMVSAPFWEGCSAGEIRYQCCNDCDAITMNPSPACSACFGPNLRWEASSGKGSVYSYTVVWRPQTPDFEVPYVPAIIEMEEGFPLMSSIVGCDVEEIEVAMLVEAVFVKMSDEITLAYFVPEGRDLPDLAV